MLVPVPNVYQSAFAGACFTGVSDVYECSGVHQEALACRYRMSTGQELAHDWMMILASDLTTFCRTIRSMGPHLGSLTLVEIF